MEPVDAGQRQHFQGVDPMIDASQPQVEFCTHGLGQRPVGQVLHEPAPAPQQVVHPEAGEQDKGVGDQQQSGVDEFLVSQIGQAHGEGHQAEQVEQPVGAQLVVDCERVGLAILGIDILEHHRLLQWRIRRQRRQQ